MDNVTLIRLLAGILAICVIPLMVIPYWKIFSRAGFPGVLSLAMIVPLANLMVLYYVAFARWNIKPDTQGL